MMKAALRKHFQKLGKRGGTAKAANLTPQQRVDAAKKAAAARWPKPSSVLAAPQGQKDAHGKV